MKINVNDDKQIVEIWLTNSEKNDAALREGLKEIFREYKRKKYLVAVFESGSRDLYQDTLSLLIYNKRRNAELAAQREKQAFTLH